MKKTMKYPSVALFGHVVINSAVFAGVMSVAFVVGAVRKWLLRYGMDPAQGYVFSVAEWLLILGDLFVFGILTTRGAKHFLSESRKPEEENPDAGDGVQSS